MFNTFEVRGLLFRGQKNISSDRISSLIYTISPSSNPETRGEREISIIHCYCSLPDSPSVFILNVELLTVFEIRNMANLPPDAQETSTNCTVTHWQPRVPDR